MREQQGEHTTHPETTDSTPVLRGASNAIPVYLCGGTEKKREKTKKKITDKGERRGKLERERQ